ncbi:MAG TPA: hypothetical protein VGG68_08705 [Caulobacteraceae bacterium]
MNETDPRVRTIEALIQCARDAARLKTVSSLALAARLHLKAWELEHEPSAETPAESHAGLLEWAAAETARRQPRGDPGDDT